jgi:hypothetical protein
MNSKLLFLIVSVLPHPFHLRDGKLPRDEARGSILPSGDSSRACGRPGGAHPWLTLFEGLFPAVPSKR